MSIWDNVMTTDPAHTKDSPQGGGQTAIATQYTIEKATKQFGPIGTGWGIEVTEPIFRIHEPTKEETVTVGVRLWYRQDNQSMPCHVPSDAGYIYTTDFVHYKNKQGEWRSDVDAIKKATTDGMTKCFSYLGFSADVFLGMYDKASYKMKVRALFNAITPEQSKEAIELAYEIVDENTKNRVLETLNSGQVDKNNFAQFIESINAAINKQKQPAEAQ
mgnify:FL=1